MTTGHLKAQRPDSLRIEYINNLADPHFHLRQTPFDQVQVLDNRFDTVTMYISRDWDAPPAQYTFREPASRVIREFLQGELHSLKKGNKTLLLNIRQMRSPNLRYVQRKSKMAQSVDIFEEYQNCILFAGEAYYKTGKDRYRPILSFDYYLHELSIYRNMNRELGWLLNRVLAAAGQIGGIIPPAPRGFYNRLHAKREAVYFTYAKDTADLSLAEVNRPERSVWGGYPAWTHPSVASGVFMNFDDFKDGYLYETPVGMSYNSADSLYRLNPGPRAPLFEGPHSFWPYVVADRGDYYISLGRNLYVPLSPGDNTFTFYVPHSLPDMYSISAGMSSWRDSVARAGGSGWNNSGANFAGGNFLIDLGVLLAFNLIVYSVTPSAHHPQVTIKKPKAPDIDLRHCYIDMDSGDFIYY